MRLMPIAVAGLTAVFGFRLLRREWDRINRELDQVRAVEGKGAPVLRRDARSGDWRPS